MRAGRKGKRRHRILYVCFMLALAGYLAMSVFLMDRFFPGTLVNGMDCDWRPVSEVEQELLSQAKMMPLTLVERDGTREQLTMEELQGHYEVHHEVQQIKRKQNGFLWPRMFVVQDSYTVLPEAVFREESFWETLEKLSCVQNQAAPRDAQIMFTDTGYEVRREEEGSTLNRDRMAEAVRQAFTDMKTELNLAEAGCYQEPALRSDSGSFQRMTEQLDTWFSAQVTYEIGEEPVMIDAGQLQEWIQISGEEAVLQEEKVAAYVDALADTYDPQVTKRVFYSTLRGRVVLTDKKHKWHLDRERETQALISCIREGGTICREPYYQIPSGSQMGSEIGDTYVEVDVSAQHLWVYHDGEMVLETDVVTGNMSRNYGTPGILAYIYAKQRDRTLRGENYASFVKYWVPFYRGYGIHDASWRKSFGGSIYLTNGSHGCVNIPPSVMPELYEKVEVGMPVIVYY